MGQYLATGLVTQMSVSKQQMEKGKISKEEVREILEKKLHYDMRIFDEKEEEEAFIWSINENELGKELIPFLKKMLAELTGNSIEVDELIEKLEKSTPDKYIEIADEDSMYNYRIDSYGEDEYLSFQNKDFRPRLNISFETIMFHSEGKISMESYGGQFNFFKYCITQAYKEFKLSSAIRIYITG